MNAWPRQPFVGIALGAVLGIILADRWPDWPVGLALLVCLAVVALVRRSSLATCAFVAAGFFFLHSVALTASTGARLAEKLGDQPQAITASGVVVSEPRVSERGVASFRLRLSSFERDGEAVRSDAAIFARWRGEVGYGDELQLFGVARPAAGPRNPGEFDMRAYLGRRDIGHVLIAGHSENGRVVARDRGNPIMRAATSSREWMQAALVRGLEDAPELNGLISGMVLGVRDGTDDEIEERFQHTGTLHLFAVSGLNVAMLAALLWIIATAVRIPRKWAIVLIILALLFYAAITGLNTSSIRAALMGAVLLGGFLFDRKVLLFNSVAAAAVLILCYDTNQFFSTGFQLSFAVVIAIIWLAEWLHRIFVGWCAPDPFLPKSLLGPLQKTWQRAWGGVARGSSVSLAAWVGSLPLILPYFYLVTPVSLVANLIVVPLAFLVLAVGLMSLLITPLVPWLAIVFNNANWSLAAAILASVDLFARAPAGHFYLEPRWPDGAQAEITVLDLGAGGAVHARSGGSDWLVDAGGERHFKAIVRGYLRSRGINRLDGMILTHGDSAHIGAATAVLRSFSLRTLHDTAAPDRSPVHRGLIAFLKDRGIHRRLLRASDEVMLGPHVAARVLFPPADHKERIADDNALVLQLIVQDRWRVLLMSDSGEPTESFLLASGVDLRSDIIIKGQHPSGRSGSAELIERVQPQVIVATSREFPQHESVTNEWAEGVRARGIKLLRQDETGGVALRFYRDRFEAEAFRGSEVYRSARR